MRTQRKPHEACLKQVEPIENRDPEELAEMLSDELMIWSGDFIEGNPLTTDQKEALAAKQRYKESLPENYEVAA